VPDNSENIRRIASFLWEVAQDLHGAVAKSENQNIILPLTVLRRLDYALAPTKAKVLETEAKLKAKGLDTWWNLASPLRHLSPSRALSRIQTTAGNTPRPK